MYTDNRGGERVSGIDNLIPMQPGELSSEEAKQRGSKGGKKSGKVRREKANLRKAAQALLDSTFSLPDGSRKTGQEIAVESILVNLQNADGKNYGKALQALITLTGADISAESKAHTKAQTAYIKAKTDLLTGQDTSAIDRLDAILSGIRETAGAGPEPEPEQEST